MENASRALVMAGGVLIALMIVAVLLYTVNSATSMKNAEEEQLKQEQIIEFNKEYESYQKNLMRGTDVITVCNKVIDYNKRNVDKPLYQITVKLTLTTVEDGMLEGSVTVNGRRGYMNGDIPKTVIQAGIPFEIKTENEQYKAFYKNEEARFKFKRRYFKCAKLEYNQETGLVNRIEFEEVDVKEVVDKDEEKWNKKITWEE